MMTQATNSPYTPIAFSGRNLWIWVHLAKSHPKYEGEHEAFAAYPSDVPEDGTIRIMERRATELGLSYPPLKAPYQNYIRIDLLTMEHL